MAVLLVGLAACGSDGGNGTTEPPPQQQVGTVRGRVLSTGDTALANVAITAQRSGATARDATTDATGTFQIANLSVGGWTVSASPPTGYEADGSMSASAQVTAGQTTDMSAFRMRRVPTQPPSNFVEVTMTGSTFSPTTVTVAVGGTVRWTNYDQIEHNTTSSGNWSSGNLANGQEFQRVFPAAGTFSYQCTLHAGMNGTVVVQ